jgi:hypothetical protein
MKAEERVGDAEYLNLLQAAMAERDALRSRFQSAPGGIPGAAVPAPPTSTSGSDGEAASLDEEVPELVEQIVEDQDNHSEE